MLDKLKYYRKKKVLITGNTGVKGAWLSLFLKSLGAKVIGYSDGIYWKNGIFNNKNTPAEKTTTSGAQELDTKNELDALKEEMQQALKG